MRRQQSVLSAVYSSRFVLSQWFKAWIRHSFSLDQSVLNFCSTATRSQRRGPTPPPPVSSIRIVLWDIKEGIRKVSESTGSRQQWLEAATAAKDGRLDGHLFTEFGRLRQATWRHRSRLESAHHLHHHRPPPRLYCVHTRRDNAHATCHRSHSVTCHPAKLRHQTTARKCA